MKARGLHSGYKGDDRMKEHRREIVILFVILFLVMVGFGIVIPTIPYFVVHLGGSPTILGFFMASYSLMQFIFAPIWGNLSDRIGRRPVILIGLGGYGLTFILFGFSNQLWMIFLVRILSGIISSATLPTAMAYVADITEGNERSKGMGLMGAAMGLGMIVGPAIGGLLGHHGFALPFFVAGSLAILTWPFALIMLPESLSNEQHAAKPTRQRISWNVLQDPLLVLFALGFVITFAMAMFEATLALFAAAKISGFGTREMGILFAILGVFGVIVQGGLIGRMSKRFGEKNLIVVGLLCAIAGMLLLLTASNIIMMTIMAVIFNTGVSIINPLASSLVSQNSNDGQGAAMGIMQSANSLGRIIGPIMGGILFDMQINIPYLAGAFILLLFMLVTANKLSRYMKTSPTPVES
jgi:DHA1 family multidrug resistance protein-like MFS transporter